jgi:hypothetical protein
MFLVERRIAVSRLKKSTAPTAVIIFSDRKNQVRSCRRRFAAKNKVWPANLIACPIFFSIESTEGSKLTKAIVRGAMFWPSRTHRGK